jgi:hypothetical protein
VEASDVKGAPATDAPAGGRWVLIALVMCIALVAGVVEGPGIVVGVQRGVLLSPMTGTWAGNWLDWDSAVMLDIDGDGSLTIGNGQGLSATGHVIHRSGDRYLAVIDHVEHGHVSSRSMGLVYESSWWGDVGRVRVDTDDPGICSGDACTLGPTAKATAA